MPLTKLENLISSKTGRYLYVSPDDFNASDALDNRGNSPTRPFLTIQRAFLEVARYSYVPGQENDRFDQFTIMLSPGNHYIDNRPGIMNPEEIVPFAFNQATQEWEDNSIVDLKNPNNILYKFNGPNGGATIPRGTSLVGMDLRRTRLHPLYVPDPADKDVPRCTLFNVTGGCYFWQFTILDGDVEPNSPLYDAQAGIGKVYSQPNSTITQVPYYSHHKICNFEFASREDLGLLYRKIARAFSLYQPTIDDPGEFTQRPQENRIVGPLQDAIRIDSITVNNVVGTTALDVTVKTKTNHGYYVGQAVAVSNLRSTLPAGATTAIPLANDPLTGVFAVRGISITDPKEFSYRVEGKNAAAVGLGDRIGQPITPPTLDTNAITQAEVDSVESASPYVFNVSIRSTWGICGIHADGSKASGFKSMVIAQYTGVSLQRDDRAFIRYDEFSNTWNQAPLTDAFATTPYHTKGDAYWKDDWRNFHVKASNDAFIQNVSIFAVGFADHFLMESGGDMSITNSNSNFGNTSLHAIGYKGYSFAQDQGGYISHIVPPKKVTTTTKKLQYYTFNQIKSRNSNAQNFDGPGGTSSITTKLYLGHETAGDPLIKPATVVGGFRIGAKAHDKIYVKLDSATGFTGSIRSAEIAPAGYRKWSVAMSTLSPTVSTGVSNNDQDAANLIDLNRDFIASETYGYITRKYPYLLTRDISINKCRRDVGYILEAVANDLRVGGNVNAVQAAQAYYTGNNLDYIESEKEETLDAFNYARSLAIGAMRNWNFYINNCSTFINQATVTVPAGITTIGIVEGMSVTATVAAGQTNPIPAGTYVREIISTTQFKLGNRNDTEDVNATATIIATGASAGGVTLNFELTQGKFATSSGRNFDAGTLINLNKEFIAEEALNLAKAQYPAVTVPNDTKCKRDIKYVLEGVIKDLGNFGNSGIVEAAEAYVGAPSRYFDAKNLILANRREIVDKAAAKLAIDYPDFYYGGSGFTNGGDAQTNVFSRYKDSYRLIQQNRAEIINNAYNALVTNGLPNPQPTDLENKCKRDIGYFIDAVSTDLTTLGNSYSIDFIRQYFVADKVNGKVLTFTNTAGTTLANRANRVYSGIATTTNGSGIGATFNVNRNSTGAIGSITIATGGYKYAVGNTITIPGSAIGGVDLVDNIVVTVSTVEQAWITGGLQGEETQSIFAYNAAIAQMKRAITNQLTVKDLSLTGDPAPNTPESGVSVFGTPGNTANNTDLQSCTNVQQTLDTLGNIIFARIRQGDLVTATTQNPALPTINYGSAPEFQAKCKRDIGYIVDAIADDLALGGNNNIITATKFYFDSTGNTLITNGLAGEISQSVTAFSAARDLCFKAVTNQLNVRDFDISPGPAQIGVAGPNIPNDNPNSCLDVRNTIDSLFGIILTKLQNGNYQYPPLRYNAGAESLVGELDMSVYAYKKARDLAILAMRNWRTGDGTSTDPLYVKNSNTLLNYSVDNSIDTTTAGVPVCADVAYAIATEFDILLGALTNTTALPPKTFGSSEYVERQRPQRDNSIINDTTTPTNKCAGTKDAIIEKMRVIESIIRNGADAEPLVSQLVNTSSFAQRATLFRVAGANPHNLETATPVRLVARARVDSTTGRPVNVDKRLIRLPKGFESNKVYYVIAPGKITAPFDYSAGGATSQFNDGQVFMLATSRENATAGNYIYSSETNGLDPDVQIEVHQYLTDVNYDLHRYTCSLVSSRVFQTSTNHVFDTGIAGVQVQKVFFYPLEENLVNGQAIGAALNTLPAKTSGGRLEINRTFYVGRPATYTTNNQFSIYLTESDAINRQNALQFNFPFTYSFQVFANRKRSPFGYDPLQSGWFIKTLLSTNEIYARLTLNDPNLGSSYANKPEKTPDSFFYRADDARDKSDKVYRFRYVIPNYRDDVRDPINGFVMKIRTDETRKLLPQRLLLKPVAQNDPKTATFFETGVQNPKRLGLPATSSQAAVTYDPYNPTNRKRIAGTSTSSNISFTIQSAKIVTGDYLEMVVFDHGLDLESLKAKRFVTVKVAQPQGGNGEFLTNSRIDWYGEYTGSAIVHSWFGTEPVEGGTETFNYLILKDVEGEIDFDEKTQTFFRQTISGQADVTAELISRPNFGKEDKSEYLYGVEASNVYTVTPGDIITDDAARQYRVMSVEDVEDLEQSYYIYKIDEIQRRIPRQQDGVYYLTAIRGDISPYPTGAGVGTNFRNFKFSQPVSRLYPLAYKNDPLLFQYDGADELGGNQNIQIVDPPASVCAADNYVHGSVSINDAKNSLTKEAVLDFTQDPGSGNYTFTGNNVLKALPGAAASGAEERLIPIAGDSAYPLEQRLYVELRRPSIARAGNHTFEYLGFGPGNYSTGFPARQTVILTSVQDFYAQAKKQDAGIVFYTGINSNGELYIGNKKINAITGEESFVEPIILEEEEADAGDLGSLVTVFEDPVTFENIITLNAPPNLKNFFNSPVEVNVDPEFNGIMTPPSLRVVSRPGNRQALLPGDDDPLIDTTKAGDIIIDKNRVRAAIFDMNTRGTQRYSFRTAINNNTPNQDTSGLRARINSNQTLQFGSSVPLSGDVVLKGAEVGYSGSLGWVYANTFSAYRLNAAAGQESSIDITGIQFYPNLNIIKLIFQVGKVNFSTTNPGASLGITTNTQIRITGAIDRLAVLNGVHTVYNNPTEGYEYNASNSYVYLLTTRASEATLIGSPPYVYSVVSIVQPTIEIARSDSQWKEVGVIGSESIRTRTSQYGDYRLGINTVARANSTDWNVGYVTTSTDPRANLDVVGNAFISGKLQNNFTDLATFSNTNKAFIVGGDSANPDTTATFRISTVPLPSPGATADLGGGRIGINVGDGALDKNLVVSGDARITGDFTFQSDIDVNGGDIRSTSGAFSIANQSGTSNLTLSGYATTINLGNLTTSSQTINVGNAASSQTINIATAATGQTRLNIHTNSTDSVINLGTVPNTPNTTSSLITLGGAFENRASSRFRVKNYQTVLDGILTINGGIINTTSTTGEFSIFTEGLNTLSIGSSVGNLNLGGVAGFTNIRHGIKVAGAAFFESDVTQNGGFRNSSVGVDRNVLGSIRIFSVARNANVATIVTVNPHNLATGNLVSVRCSFDSFATVNTVSITVVDSTTFTYSNTGSNVTTTSATGSVTTGIGFNQATGSLANLNIDYYSVSDSVDGAANVQTVTSNKLLVEGHWFSQNDAVRFIDVGNLSGVSVNTVYYVRERDLAGFTLQNNSGGLITIGLIGGATNAGTARIGLSQTFVDTAGDLPWGDNSFLNTDGTWTLPINNPRGIAINQLYLIGTEIVKTVSFPTSFNPDSPTTYTVRVERAQDGTARTSHPDGERLYRLVKQENASYIFPNPVLATATTVNIAEFSGTLRLGDLLRINKGLQNEEYVRISQINTSDAQAFVINNGDFGTTVLPKNPLQMLKTISTTGNTQIIGDVIIGYDTSQNSENPANDLALADYYQAPSSTSVGPAISQSGGGNLKVHNSIELSGNTTTSTPGRQYFVITNGSIPKFFVESASGDTKLYDGADFKIYKDSFYTSGNFDKGRVDGAVNLALEVLGDTGNTKIAGTLRAGDDFAVGTLANSSNAETVTNVFTSRFTVDAQTGDTFVGRYLTVNGNSTASPSAGVNTLSVNGLGVSGAKPFRIKQDASIDAFGENNFYNINGGRKTVFVSTQGNTDSTAYNLKPNLQYLVRPSSNLVLRLPSNAITGDIVRIVDVGGVLNFAINLIIRAPAGVRLQNSSTGSNLGGLGSAYAGGELIVNTPNAGFGLIYSGDTDGDGNGIPSDQQGWYLMEI